MATPPDPPNPPLDGGTSEQAQATDDANPAMEEHAQTTSSSATSQAEDDSNPPMDETGEGSRADTAELQNPEP